METLCTSGSRVCYKYQGNIPVLVQAWIVLITQLQMTYWLTHVHTHTYSPTPSASPDKASLPFKIILHDTWAVTYSTWNIKMANLYTDIHWVCRQWSQKLCGIRVVWHCQWSKGVHDPTNEMLHLQQVHTMWLYMGSLHNTLGMMINLYLHIKIDIIVKLDL